MFRINLFVATMSVILWLILGDSNDISFAKNNLPDMAEENLKNQIAAQKNLYHLFR